jgi:hypothetical protein
MLKQVICDVQAVVLTCTRNSGPEGLQQAAKYSLPAISINREDVLSKANTSSGITDRPAVPACGANNC